MRIEDFKNASDDELLRMADACFQRAAETSLAPPITINLLQAQFFLNEIDRRESQRQRQHDLKIVRRDLILELVIIGLILGEIILGLWEGNKQATILDQMRASMVAAASAATLQAKGLRELTDEQGKSLDSLTKMNGRLQDSVKKTSDMAVAMQKQLQILQDEQAERQAELARKPKLELYIENVPLNSFGVTFKAREATETKLTFDIVLTNSGDATATRGLLRVIAFARGVTMDCSSPWQKVYESEEDSPQHTILIPFDYIRPGARIPMSITFTYSAGQVPFSVNFSVDADEIPTGTALGGMTARPLERKP